MTDVIAAVLAAQLRGVVRLEIGHVLNRVSVRAALGPHDVDALAMQIVETRDPRSVSAIVTAIDRTQAHAASGARADLRYAIRAFDARGRIVGRVYLDAFGRRGLIDGSPVTFESDAIKRALVAAAPSLAR